MSMTILIVLACVAVAVVLIIIFFIFGRGETRFTFDIGGSTPRAAGGSDTSADTNFKTRLNGLAIFSGAVVTALLAKLWSMQLLSSDSYTQQAESTGLVPYQLQHLGGASLTAMASNSLRIGHH